MSAYNMPDPAYKRLSFRALDYGLLYNLHKRIFPMIFIILIIITVCVVLAYSLNSRAIPRQFVVGMCITFSILGVLWTVVSAIRCCRPKCAGKHNLRLESPAAEPMPAPEMTRTEWDGIGPRDLYDQPKQAPPPRRQGRDSAGFGDLSDRFKQVLKDWLDEHYPFWHYRGRVRARAPAHASRERDPSATRYAPHNQHDRRREDAAEREGMLIQRRRSYLDPSDSGMTNAEAEDLYRRQRDRDYRAARDDPRRPHQAYCETDDNRSQGSEITEVEPPRVVLRQDYRHYNVLPREMDRLVNAKNVCVYVNLPAPIHNLRR
ncbi:hypothetical protein VF21_02278 [Pseudogymnoascus sp. 05NY08]|nr:hypothetical protein VF21_02278 [Pseudogymnoascus sp. 05NY08]